MKQRYKIVAICRDKRGRILSKAYNNYNKSHPLQKHFAELVNKPNNIYLHAEIAAIIKAGTNIIHSIEIKGETKCGKVINCKPCPICRKAIDTYGIKFITYSVK